MNLLKKKKESTHIRTCLYATVKCFHLFFKFVFYVNYVPRYGVRFSTISEDIVINEMWYLISSEPELSEGACKFIILTV